MICTAVSLAVLALFTTVVTPFPYFVSLPFYIPGAHPPRFTSCTTVQINWHHTSWAHCTFTFFQRGKKLHGHLQCSGRLTPANRKGGDAFRYDFFLPFIGQKRRRSCLLSGFEMYIPPRRSHF
ncbi:hypothetical protein BJX64DRAFT_143907 [Aspergillus heterothallicus]